MNYTKMMEEMEMQYREQSCLKDRSDYAMYYTRIWPAPILILGINPGGCPSNYYPDGVRLKNDPKTRGAASAGYYEKGEHSMLDCCWPENEIVDLLAKILGDRKKIRRKVVKTNLAFRRSPNTDLFKKINQMTLNEGYKEAAPFIRKIGEIVQPKLVILEGSILTEFKRTMNVVDSKKISKSIKTCHRGKRIDLYYAERVTIPNISKKVVIVKLAHPSYHGREYGKKGVDIRIKQLIDL